MSITSNTAPPSKLRSPSNLISPLVVIKSAVPSSDPLQTDDNYCETYIVNQLLLSDLRHQLYMRHELGPTSPHKKMTKSSYCISISHRQLGEIIIRLWRTTESFQKNYFISFTTIEHKFLILLIVPHKHDLRCASSHPKIQQPSGSAHQHPKLIISK